MRNFPRQSVRRVGVRALLMAPVLLFGLTCTNLNEVPHDALTTNNAFHTDAEIIAGVGGVYANLRNAEWVGYLTLNDLTTDVMIVPTRGNDWNDNGQWLDLHRQTWTANSAGTSAFVNGAWQDMFGGIAKANLMIEIVNNNVSAAGKKDSLVAELRTLRAYYYYILMDMFGGVPLATTTELKQYPRSTRTEVFAFIEKEITESVGLLPKKWDGANYGRLTKYAGYSILASMYVNAGVFNKNTGVNANAYNSCAGVNVAGGKTGCQAAIDAASQVINNGGYTLNTDWKRNFTADNETSPENIFVIVHAREGQDVGGNFPMRTLHYNQLSTGQGGPWNGFATLAETYQQFDATDVRKGMWLEGDAFSFETGLKVNDRNGNPLKFSIQIPDAEKADEGTGVRFNKFPPIASPPRGSAQPNDFTLFRLAEMYLIRAEAELELGQLANAIADLKVVHDLRNPGNPISAGLSAAQTRDAILKERLLEFAGEGKRRTDLIRHGKFLKQWSTTMVHGKTDKSAETYRILFPVPAPQIANNPLLTQNPGY